MHHHYLRFAEVRMVSVSSLPDSVRRRAFDLSRLIFDRTAAHLAHGQVAITYPDGLSRTYGSTPPAVELRIDNDDFFRRIAIHGEVGFGEAYMDGLWRTNDLVELLLIGLRNRERLNFNQLRFTLPSRLWHSALHLRNRPVRSRSEHNIHAHYDLGNEFFRLFLDETLGYSCPIFLKPDESLEEGHLNKFRVLCEKIGIAATDRVLEIGTGWGGFAIYAAQHHGCHVTAITIAKEQYDYTRGLVQRLGLSELVDVQYRDYRDVTGSFDKIVAIEMLEHVGTQHYRGYFRQCDRLLRPGGLAAFQVIALSGQAVIETRNSGSWIQKYIYPGGTLPSISMIDTALAPSQLRLIGVEEIGKHYPAALQEWRHRFLANTAAVHALGFDDRFIRTWEYYLASCEAAFRAGYLRDVQLVMDKAGRPA